MTMAQIKKTILQDGAGHYARVKIHALILATFTKLAGAL